MNVQDLYAIFLKHPQICTDSRQIKPGCIFIALKGGQFDGNEFAANAIREGAAYAIIDNPAYKADDKHLLVPDVLDSVHQMAIMHRQKFTCPVIGITGSNGKTTTKELITKVLSTKYNTLSTLGNYNNHIGVPLTVLRMTDEHQIAVIEMGANHIGEIASLCKLAQPTHGILTNVGYAHLEGFGSFEGVIKAKTELYKHIRLVDGSIFIDADNEILMTHAAGIHKITYGEGTRAQNRGEVTKGDPYLQVAWKADGESRLIMTNLVGVYNLKNILAAISVGRYFEVPANDIVSAIESYVPSNLRSQILKTDRNEIVLDAYNANPSSMAAAINNFAALGDANKLLILGEMLEMGHFAGEQHKIILELVTEKGFTNAIFVGDHFYDLKEERPNKFFRTTSEAAQWLEYQNFSGYTVLIKGSRKMKLESLTKLL